MARPALLTDDQKIFITDIKRELPDLTAAEITGAVWSYLVLKEEQQDHKLDDKDILRIENEQLSESAIISFLTDLKNRLKAKTDNPLDREWTLASLSDNRWIFPSESLPYILKIKEMCIKGHTKFTVRQAIWVSRLYALPHHEPKDFSSARQWIQPFRPKVKDLYTVTWLLASYEETCELAKTPFDYSPFEAPSIALMYSRVGNYTYDHVKELKSAMKHLADITDEAELEGENNNERTDS